MRPIDTENLRRIDEAGAISGDPVLREGEFLIAASAEEIASLREELMFSANGIAGQIHAHRVLSNTNKNYGTRPGYLSELEARQRNLELIRAGLPEALQATPPEHSK